MKKKITGAKVFFFFCVCPCGIMTSFSLNFSSSLKRKKKTKQRNWNCVFIFGSVPHPEGRGILHLTLSASFILTGLYLRHQNRPDTRTHMGEGKKNVYSLLSRSHYPTHPHPPIMFFSRSSSIFSSVRACERGKNIIVSCPLSFSLCLFLLRAYG